MSIKIPEILVIGGDNGTGKSSVAKAMSGDFFEEPISITTRPPRLRDDGTIEEHGKEYYFTDNASFDKNKCFEYTKREADDGSIVFYGTLAEEVIRIWESGKIPTPVLDPVGVNAFKKKAFNPEIQKMIDDYLKANDLESFKVYSLILDINKAEVFSTLVPKFGKRVAMSRMKRGDIRKEIDEMELDVNADFISQSFKETDILVSNILNTCKTNQNTTLSMLSSKKKEPSLVKQKKKPTQ